jgi:hypothetical protein
VMSRNSRKNSSKFMRAILSVVQALQLSPLRKVW